MCKGAEEKKNSCRDKGSEREKQEKKGSEADNGKLRRRWSPCHTHLPERRETRDSRNGECLKSEVSFRAEKRIQESRSRAQVHRSHRDGIPRSSPSSHRHKQSRRVGCDKADSEVVEIRSDILLTSVWGRRIWTACGLSAQRGIGQRSLLHKIEKS